MILIVTNFPRSTLDHGKRYSFFYSDHQKETFRLIVLRPGVKSTEVQSKQKIDPFGGTSASVFWWAEAGGGLQQVEEGVRTGGAVWFREVGRVEGNEGVEISSSVVPRLIICFIWLLSKWVIKNLLSLIYLSNGLQPQRFRYSLHHRRGSSWN